MTRAILALVIIALPIFVSAEMIFLDINNAPHEINHCRAGLEDKARRTGASVEPLHVVSSTPGDTADANGVRRSNTYWRLREKIIQMRQEGRRIDSIVISGEDGSGHFFGENGDFYAHELRELYNEFPELQQSLKSAALWGCYPTSVHGAEQFWVNRMPGMQFTMGFTLQGPSKERESNWDLLRQFCERREEAAEATTMDALCRFYDSIRQITPTSVGICNRVGLASDSYARPGSPERCFTYDDLHARCGEFIGNYDQAEAIYEQYRQGLREDFEVDANGNISALRDFYNDVQLWRHCAERFRTERGYDMPYAPDIIRLIKFDKLKANIMKMNGPQMAQYDAMLNNMGLGQYRLGDLSALSRAEIIRRIEGVVVALEQLQRTGQVTVQPTVPANRPAAVAAPAQPSVASPFIFADVNRAPVAPPPPPQPEPVTPTQPVTLTSQGNLVNGVETARALRMAQCLRMTLVNTDYRCTRFSMVSDHPNFPAACVMSYERAGQRLQNDPC